MGRLRQLHSKKQCPLQLKTLVGHSSQYAWGIMDNPNEGRPLDKSLERTLVVYADQFELAVQNGRDVVAAGVANAFIQILGRFFPAALSAFCSGELRNIRPSILRSPSGPVSPPDLAYLGIVRPAIRGFKEAISSGNIGSAITALGGAGIFAEEGGPQEELRGLETSLARTGGPMRLEYLPRAAKLAFWAGDTDKAERYAAEAIKLEPAGDTFSDGEATHDGKMILGLIALLRDDTERAKTCLLESARTSGLGYMSMTGPNLSLASELLKRDEREVVIGYLHECRRFWIGGRDVLDTWIVKIRGGEYLEFDPLRLSL